MSHAPLAAYPALRLRRLRQADWIRRLVRETVLHAVRPDLVDGGPRGRRRGPGGLDAGRRAPVGQGRPPRPPCEARDLGIPAIAIFPHIDGAKKDAAGTMAADPDGVIPRAVKAMKDAAPEVGIMCDVALDPFTDHGHDGVVEDGQHPQRPDHRAPDRTGR